MYLWLYLIHGTQFFLFSEFFWQFVKLFSIGTYTSCIFFAFLLSCHHVLNLSLHSTCTLSDLSYLCILFIPVFSSAYTIFVITGDTNIKCYPLSQYSILCQCFHFIIHNIHFIEHHVEDEIFNFYITSLNSSQSFK